MANTYSSSLFADWLIKERRGQYKMALEYICLALVFFIVVDYGYYVRVFLIFLASPIIARVYKMKTENDLYKPMKLRGIVLPIDLDLHLHMNNARYARECDFGRMEWWFVSGLVKSSRKLKTGLVVAAISMRYRRSLTVFQRFNVQTRLLCWTEKDMYLEQRIVKTDGFIAAIAYVKMSTVGKASVDELFMDMFGRTFYSRPPPPEIVPWMESISLSKKALRPII